MEAKRFLQGIGSDVVADFVKNRSILSFEEYLNLFLQEPRRQARNAAQYLRDALDYFGVEQVPHPSGKIRRFRLFDAAANDGRFPSDARVPRTVGTKFTSTVDCWWRFSE